MRACDSPPDCVSGGVDLSGEVHWGAAGFGSTLGVGGAADIDEPQGVGLVGGELVRSGEHGGDELFVGGYVCRPA